MTEFKVKILSAYRCWYEGKIGEEFDAVLVNLFDRKYYQIVGPGSNYLGCIRIEDAIVIKETPKFKQGDRVIAVKNTPDVQEGWVGYIDQKFENSVWGASRQLGDESEVYFLEDELELLPAQPKKEESKEEHSDAVNSPKHYAVFDEIEAIEIIASTLTQEQFKGYCFGNLLKYRLRVGKKDDVMQELGKADKYEEIYNKYKSLCK